MASEGYDPAGDVPANQRCRFATIVTRDYDGFDTPSTLNRSGVFRLNIAVGRDTYRELLGRAPAEHADLHAGFDYTAEDRLLPHPVYVPQAWVSILNPGEATSRQVRSLLAGAHARAAERYERPRAT